MCVCVVSICAGIHSISRRQRIFAVNHSIHGREIYRHLSSDARADHVHGQSRQAHHRRAVGLWRRLLRPVARTYQTQVGSRHHITIAR